MSWDRGPLRALPTMPSRRFSQKYRMPPDYTRHNSALLFAALNVLDGLGRGQSVQ
jgi:hypothetical protein